MVDVKKNYDQKIAEVSCPEKTKVKYNVHKAPGGFIFYMVTPTKGPAPEALAGRFSSLDKAVDAVVDYLTKMKETQAVKNDRLHENRQKRKAEKDGSTTESEGS